MLSSAILPARLELVSDRSWSSIMPSSFARLLSGRGSLGSMADEEAAVSPFVEGGFCATDQYVDLRYLKTNSRLTRHSENMRLSLCRRSVMHAWLAHGHHLASAPTPPSQRLR